jgi:hypothetical protein
MIGGLLTSTHHARVRPDDYTLFEEGWGMKHEVASEWNHSWLRLQRVGIGGRDCRPVASGMVWKTAPTVN